MTEEERKTLSAIGKHEAATVKTEREKLLEEAKAIVCGDRDQQYGKPEDSFYVIAKLWSAYTICYINERDVAMMMILLKVARDVSGESKRDNLIDIAGYAACAAECDVLSQKEETTIYGDGVPFDSAKRKL